MPQSFAQAVHRWATDHGLSDEQFVVWLKNAKGVPEDPWDADILLKVIGEERSYYSRMGTDADFAREIAAAIDLDSEEILEIILDNARRAIDPQVQKGLLKAYAGLLDTVRPMVYSVGDAS